MFSRHKTPEGYFNATGMIVPNNAGVKLKAAHFIDNLRVREKLSLVGKRPIVYRGRGACTFIPLELKNLFIAWMALNTRGKL